MRYWAICILLCSLCASVTGQSIFTSTGGGGDWTDPNSWSENNQGNPDDADGIPDGDDNVIITSGNPININTATGQNCEDLTLTTGILTFVLAGGDLDVEGTLTMSGTSSIVAGALITDARLDHEGSTMTISNGATATLGAVRFESAGTATVSGSLDFSNVTGEKIFTNLTLEASGTFDNSTVAEAFTFAGNIINNGGTWNACPNTTDCPYTFTSATATISGAGTVNATDLTINNPASLTNNGTIVLTDDLTGTGTFTNGATGTLTLSENGTYSVSTLTLNTVGNTVIYDGTTSDILLAGPYYDLEINMDASTTPIEMNGVGVTVNNDVTITSGILRAKSAHTLAITNDVTIASDGEFESETNGATTNIGGDVTVNGGDFDQNEGTVNITGSLTINSGTLIMTDDDSVLDVDGTYTAAGGTNSLINGTFTPANATINTGQSVSFAGIDLTAGGTTTVNGTLTFNGTTGTKTLNDVTMGGTGNINFTVNETVGIGGDLSMSGTSSVTGSSGSQILNVTGGINVTSGTGTIGALQVNVTGESTIDGTLEFTSATGAKSFGNVILAASGTWDNSAVSQAFTFSGNLTNNGGTWSGCASTTGCPYTMTSNTGTISGAGTINVTDFIINAPASITNNGTVVMTDDLTGTGTFTNGATGTLTISENGTYSITTLVFSTAGNTVIYDGTVADVILPGPYHNLTINMDVASTLCEVNSSSVTVNNDMTITSGRVRLTTAHTLTVGGDIDIGANGELEPNINGSQIDLTGSLTVAGGEYDQNEGTVNVGSNFTINSGTFNVTDDDSVLDVDGTFTVAGGTNSFVNGTFTPNAVNISSGQSISFAGIDLTASTTTTINGTVTINGSTGTKSVNNLTLGGTGNLNFTVDETVTVNGNLSMSGTSSITGTSNNQVLDVTGTLGVTSGTGSIGGIQLNVTGASTMDGTLAFTSATGDKSFADITVNASGGWDNSAVSEEFTVSGNLTNNGGTWNACATTTGCPFTMTSATATVSGAGTVNVTDMIINNPATVTNNGNLTLTDDLTGTGTFTNGATGTLTLSEDGSYTVSTLTLNTVGNTVVYDGTVTDVLLPGPFHNLTINMDASSTEITMDGADVQVNNDVTITSGVLSLESAHTLTVSGDMTIATNGEFQPDFVGCIANITGSMTISGGDFDQNQGTVNITNNLTIGSGTVTLDNSNSVLDIDATYQINGGSNDLNDGTVTYVDMNVAGGGTINISDPNLTSTGTTTVDNGTLTIDGNGGGYNFTNIDVNSNGTWNVTAAYDPVISGNLANDGTFTGCNGTECDYSLTSNSGTITGAADFTAMSDIILNDGASYTNTNTSGFFITDRLATTSGSGTFINGADGRMSWAGVDANWTLTNFTASADGNIVRYINTTSNQLIQPTTDASNTYHDLRIVKDAGVDMTMSADITVEGELRLRDGDVILGSNNMILGNDATIGFGGTDSYVQNTGTGRLRKMTNATGAFTAHIGTSTDYAPITLTLNSATFGASSFIEYHHTASAHPNRDDGNLPTGDDDGVAAASFISRYWTLTGSSITSPSFDASFTYADGDVTGTESHMLPVLYRVSPDFGVLDWLPSGTINYPTNAVSFTGGDAFGDLFCMDDADGRLPIVLLSFDVEAEEEGVRIDWSTASEINNEIYTIERSRNGIDFEPILYREGAGNSTETLFYSMMDKEPMEGRSYYRLKQTDFNGTFEYSEIKSVYYTEKALKPKIYPNPLIKGDKLYIQVSPDIERIAIRDMQGQLIRSVTDIPQKTKVIEVEGTNQWPTGLYLITMEGSEKPKVMKLAVK